MFGGLFIRTVLTVFIPLRLFCFDWTFTGPTWILEKSSIFLLRDNLEGKNSNNFSNQDDFY